MKYNELKQCSENEIKRHIKGMSGADLNDLLNYIKTEGSFIGLLSEIIGNEIKDRLGKTSPQLKRRKSNGN